MKFSITIPHWLFWLIPKRLMADLDDRAKLTGTSGKQWRFGKITEVNVRLDKDDPPAAAN